MATETNPFLLGLSLKDLDSNVRSEISYLDRNVTNGINTQAGNVIANTTSQGGLLRDLLTGQLHCTYEKLARLDTDRIRDNRDDFCI